MTSKSPLDRKSDVMPFIPARTQEGTLIPPCFPKIKSRDAQIADLKRFGSTSSPSTSSEDTYDLLVIGGGATGTGIALDAATRGLKVALVERDDFSSGTSSKSTKLVHGGVRYLEKAVWNLDYSQYELVVEGLRERKNFLLTAPHLTSWTPVMLPIQKLWQVPYFWMGTKCYDLLAGGEDNPSSYFLTRGKALQAFPMIRKDSLVGALVYYDGQQNDSRMNMSLATTAAHYGATIANYVQVTGLEKDSQGKICGARLRDLISDKNGDEGSEDFVVRAKGVINATGPFADAIQHMDEPKKRELIAPSSGVHIVLPQRFSPKGLGLLDPSTSDGRVMFLLPWQGRVLAGTTDTPCAIENSPTAKEADINWILSELREHLDPGVDLQREDVLAAWSGIRPLVKDPNAKNTESLVRTHLVQVSKSGLLTCVGGKWTTYRQMAEDAVDEAIKVFNLQPEPTRLQNLPSIAGPSNKLANDAAVLDGKCQTLNIRLIGAHGFSSALSPYLAKEFHLDLETADHLAHSYGDRAFEVLTSSSSTEKLSPEHPNLTAEVSYAVSHEFAQTVIDLLARRTRLAFIDAHAALEALPKVIDIMGDELHWSENRREAEWTDSVKFLGSMGLDAGLLEASRDDVVEGKIPQRRRRGEAKTSNVQSEPVVGGIDISVGMAARSA